MYSKKKAERRALPVMFMFCYATFAAFFLAAGFLAVALAGSASVSAALFMERKETSQRTMSIETLLKSQ